MQAIGLTIVFGGSPALPSAATSFQILSAWGQTYAASTWEEVENLAFHRNSRWSGKMGNFFQLGTYDNGGTLVAPYTISFTATFTNASANITAMSINPQNVCSLGMPIIFIGASTTPGYTALPYITSITSSTAVVASANFGGTTGSYSAFLLPYAPSSISDIPSTP